MQLCTGIRSGYEIAGLACSDMSEDEENHDILQADASIVFNSIKRDVLLREMNILCPKFVT